MELNLWIFVLLIISIILGSIAITFNVLLFLYRDIRYDGIDRKLFRKTKAVPGLNKLIDDAEQEYNVTLTSHARVMLRTPIEEAYERFDKYDPDVVRESISKIVGTVSNPNQTSYGSEELDSKAIIRGFHRKFCSIPPFCRKGDE